MSAVTSPLGAPSDPGPGDDPRLEPPRWDPLESWASARAKLRLLLPLNILAAGWYFSWLLRPERVGQHLLFGLLVAAELFNLVQAAGFWWTVRWAGRLDDKVRLLDPDYLATREVDVLIPAYTEPLDVVEPTVAAAMRLRGPRVKVFLLDDAGRDELADLAARHGAHYIRRPTSNGAKAGNVNYALARTSAPTVAVFDCDHVPDRRFLELTMPKLIDPRVALVQTPQYYANTGGNRLAAAAWAQQALFFGVIARGKAALGAMMCCGTNSLFRRQALTQVGYFPEGSLTEDFALSVRLHAAGWKTAYVPKVLASGLGPEDAASYVIQHQRWARGCLAGVIPTLRARLPISIRLQYLLSSMFFLSGWTFAIYLALPAVRIFTGAQPLSGATANQFLLHFAPYYGLCLATLAVAGAGAYTFAAFSVLISNYWVHIASTLLVLARRKGRFVVTPKKGSSRAQPGPVVPALVALGGLLAAVGYGIAGSRSPATLNNVAFASMHVVILLSGVAPALLPPAPEDRPAPRSDPARPPGPAVRRRVDVAV